MDEVSAVLVRTSATHPALFKYAAAEGTWQTNAGGGLRLVGLVGVVHVGRTNEELEIVQFVCEHELGVSNVI